MKPWGKGSRKSNIEDLDIKYPIFFKTTVFQIEATGNFKNLKRMQKISAISIGNSIIWSDIWHKYHEWYFKIVIQNFTSR